ncbi:hypothetical protein PybrP1_004632 [[Pythium] brassicae (nom. inval.)]|nr:hypothetical protein PybrP1_004632 [[Pythium] brassicae (nom. inval.)]
MAEEEEVVEPLHLDFEDREVYLAKIPTALGAAWKSVQESETMLGSIKLEKGRVLGRRKGYLTVNPSTLEDGIPTEYRVEISETPLKLKVFSQDGSGRMAIEGTVKNSCTILAQRNDEYRKFSKQRLIKSMVKTRIVQPLEDLPRVKKARIQFTIEKAEADGDEDTGGLKLNDKTDKKIKMSKDELKNLSFLKEVLKEICDYHRKGPNKSCYELKAQYKDGKN